MLLSTGHAKRGDNIRQDDVLWVWHVIDLMFAPKNGKK
jgi:hypothetical protein